MTASVRALLFAVFGGFIGAAPAAPVEPEQRGAVCDAGKQTQKNERPAVEASERPASGIAAAPPHAGGAPPAALGPAALAVPARHAAVAIPASRGRAIRPPFEDVRAGLLGLPPPVR